MPQANSTWGFLDAVIYWLLWPQFQFGHWGGLNQGFVVLTSIPDAPWNLIIGGGVYLSMIVVGWRWESN
mgnify:CR=1 FL=1